MTRGGLNVEPKELEDDPQLKELVDEESILYKIAHEAEQKLDEASLILSEKYKALTGKEIPEKERKFYWIKEHDILPTYKNLAPELIENKITPRMLNENNEE